MADNVTTVFDLTLKLNYKNTGCTERYPIKGSDWTAAAVNAAPIVRLRRALLGTGAEIVENRIGVRGNDGQGKFKGKESKPVIPGKLGPLPVVAITEAEAAGLQWTPNNPSTALAFLLYTATGRKSPRAFRFVPDWMVEDYLCVDSAKWDAYPVADANIVDGTNLALPTERLIRSFLAKVRDNCEHRRKTGDGPPVEYSTRDYEAMVREEVTEHRTGRPFGLKAGRYSRS